VSSLRVMIVPTFSCLVNNFNFCKMLSPSVSFHLVTSLYIERRLPPPCLHCICYYTFLLTLQLRENLLVTWQVLLNLIAYVAATRIPLYLNCSYYYTSLLTLRLREVVVFTQLLLLHLFVYITTNTILQLRIPVCIH